MFFFLKGAHMRRASQELERRRASLGSGAGLTSPRTRTEPKDPHHAAILFRDSRGVSCISLANCQML